MNYCSDIKMISELLYRYQKMVSQLNNRLTKVSYLINNSAIIKVPLLVVKKNVDIKNYISQ